MIDKEVEEIRARRRKLIQEKYKSDINNFIIEAIKWQQMNPDKIVSTIKRSVS